MASTAPKPANNTAVTNSEESIDQASTSTSKKEENKSPQNRPSDSKFKQQILKAWQPILTANTILPLFFLIGLAFIPLGVVLHIKSNRVQEYIFDYTDHVLCNSTLQPNIPCRDILKDDQLREEFGGECHCEFPADIREDIPAPVFVYYGLTNFYQNHRRYVKSRCDYQLMGIVPTKRACHGDIKTDCEKLEAACAPFDRIDDRIVVPCGAIANSLFNDTFAISTSNDEPVNLLMTNIAWPSDRNKKFFNPTNGWNATDTKIFTKPPYWSKNIYELNPNDPNENGFKNEAFIVWMRTAALPTFRKLHSRIDHSQEYFKNGLPSGKYKISVDYRFPVDSFKGRKRFIITNTSWAGGKNSFLGIAYMAVGGMCILTGFIFLFIHLKFGKSLKDLAAMVE